MNLRLSHLLLVGTTCALLLLSPQKASARYIFKHFDMNEGLSHNTVNAIAQDHQGFMWFATTNGLNRFDGNSFKTYTHSPSPLHLGNDDIKALLVASDGDIWVGTDLGIYIYSPVKDTFTFLDTKTSKGIGIYSPIFLFCEHKGNIYISVDRQGLFRYDEKKKTLTELFHPGITTLTAMAFDARGRIWMGTFQGDLYYSDDNFRSFHTYAPAGGVSFRDATILSILPMEAGHLFVGSDRTGMMELNTAAGTAKSIVSAENGKPVYVHSLLRKGNEIWTATEMGLYIYNMTSREVQHYFYEPSNPFSLSDNPLQCICADREGGVWIGSYFGGINFSPVEYSTFDIFIQRVDIPNTLQGRRVRGIVEDAGGNLWVGTEDRGLNCYNPSTGIFDFVESSLQWPNIHCLCVDGDKLWVGTFSYGLKLIDIRTRRLLRSMTADGRPGSLPDNAVFSLCRGFDGKLYVGTLGGLCRYDGKRFTHVAGGPVLMVNDIFEDSHHNLWVGTQDDGLYMRPYRSKGWQHYHPFKENRKTNKVLSVFEDRSGTIWITTQELGVFRFVPDKNYFVSVEVPKFNPENFVLEMLQDHQGDFWLTTIHGLMCYHPHSGETSFYTTFNGLLDNQFNYNSALLASNGRIYIGSVNGFVSFSPEALRRHGCDPNIVVTDLLINNVPIDVFSPNTPLKENITNTTRLVLRHGQNSFSLRVAALSFTTTWQNQMEYKLVGFDRQWKHLLGDNYITYTNLPAGSYTLRVRMKSNDGHYSPKVYELAVVVRPPMYLTWWAKLLYLLLAVSVSWAAFRYWHQRTRMRRKIAMEKFEHEKEQELYQSKISFFTDVAHEIRTPLTLIKEPLEHILKNGRHEGEEQEDLDIMDQNVSRLLNLTNQLLNFRKAEQNGLRLNFERLNIGKLLRDVYVRFTPLMREHGVEDQLQLPDEPVAAYIDKEGFTKIISNLLNNAVKYCDRLLKVELSADEETFTIRVINDGKVISRAARERLFTPFFRAEENAAKATGTGLGLALSRTLAELHGGRLVIDDSAELNIFHLTLPLRQQLNVEFPDPIAVTQEAGAVPPAHDDSKRSVLLVEDNAQMLSYERRALLPLFNVYTAASGKEALEVLADTDVDAIVSDVMMEPVDGFELCQTVKGDVNYSHIPFVLLTALTIDSAKVQGMESGADSYIEKPFSMDYLVSVIENLIRSRQRLKQAFAASPFLAMDTLSISKTDEKFLKQVEQVVQENLADSAFDIDQLASALCMSRTGLNRKLRGALDMTPNNYIKLERLKKAAHLLKSENVKVNEVAYRVGFSTPSYFTQCFVKQFGLLPKDFVAGAEPSE